MVFISFTEKSLPFPAMTKEFSGVPSPSKGGRSKAFVNALFLGFPGWSSLVLCYVPVELQPLTWRVISIGKSSQEKEGQKQHSHFQAGAVSLERIRSNLRNLESHL